MADIKNNWTREEVSSLYNQSLLDLIYQAATIHREHHDPSEVQVCTLLSIKTGGCSEDCSYCSQSSRYQTDVQREKLLSFDRVLENAKTAKANGATRFCMGAAWRQIKDNAEFDQVCEMISAVDQLGLEVCCTLGMVTKEQAEKLKKAGLHAYNHNLDTSEEYYSKIITTRTYQDRLDTLKNVRNADLTVCCGGIIGLGESSNDRIELLHTLATLDEHPESVPINLLVPVKGTPLQDQEPLASWELVRMIAVARILMPLSMVRLSAGRLSLSQETQALCFFAGANSIFAGEKLLTTPNNDVADDQLMFEALGLKTRKAFKQPTIEVSKPSLCVI
ncbi:MAG: biotin synthase BioB [Bdellovibrionota bacterium]